MAKKKYHKAKRGTKLWLIGFWATVWWAFSCLFAFLVIYLALEDYTKDTNTDKFLNVVGQTFKELLPLLGFLIVGWTIGGWLWLRELKKRKIPRRLALKDLFLTIRK